MGDSHLLLVVSVGLAGLLPFGLVMLTSFVKMAVVLSIVRSALGTGQVPPNSVITGLALVLSMVVMAPVAGQVAECIAKEDAAWQSGSAQQILAALGRTAQPIEAYLASQTQTQHYQAFAAMLDAEVEAQPTSWRALVPAYVVGQLHAAFRMGFVIYLPFLVLDMLVASVLLSLGMHMLSPTTVSLPFKLLLFALADGWTLIGQSLLGASA
jgi:type III secretion protein R